MNKKERVMNALNSKPVDYVPVSFWRHFAGLDAEGQRCVDKHIEFYRQTDLDFIKIMHDGFTAPCDLQVGSLDDLKRYRPTGRKNPYIIGLLDRTKRINAAIGDEVYTYCNVFSPFTLLRRIGDEKLHSFIQRDKATVLSAFDAMSEDLALLSELLIKEAGCLGVFIAFQGAESNRFTPEQFNEIVKPYDLKVTQAAYEASDYNILHFCGWDEIKNQLDLWRDYPGRVINWAIHVDDLTLAEGKEYFGGRVVMGGFDNRRNRVLYSSTKQEVAAETRKIINNYTQVVGSTNGLILGADCSFLTDFELDRFNWVTQEIHNNMASV